MGHGQSAAHRSLERYSFYQLPASDLGFARADAAVVISPLRPSTSCDVGLRTEEWAALAAFLADLFDVAAVGRCCRALYPVAGHELVARAYRARTLDLRQEAPPALDRRPLVHPPVAYLSKTPRPNPESINRAR